MAARETNARGRCVALLPRLPFPPTDGGAIRAHQFIKALAHRYDLDVASFLQPDAGDDQVAAARSACHRLETVPLPSGLLANAAALCRGTALGIAANHARYATPAMRRLVKAMEPGRCEVLFVNNAHMSHESRRFVNAVRVLDTQNNDAVLLGRWADMQTSSLKRAFGRRQAKLADRMLRERFRWFDLVLAVSEREAAEFREMVPDAGVMVADNGADIEFFVPGNEPREPGTLLYTGDYSWLPNEDAARHYIDDIHARIASRAEGVRVTFAGRKPAPWMLERREPWLSVPGFVDDMRVLFRRASVFVVPLRIGGGTRLKILEAMAMKIPVVSTSIGAEGIACRHEEHILLADTPQNFADAVLRLLADDGLRARLAEKARRLVEERYDWRAITGRVIDAIDGFRARKNNPR